MKITNRLANLVIDALSHSMPVHTMVKVIKRVLPGYDLHQRTGFPPSIPIPTIDAARQITTDLINDNLLIKFVEHLIDIYQNGLMGRKINIHFLPQIMDEIVTIGYVYNEQYGIFLERDVGIKTKSWGILQEGKTYEFSFLRIDIVKNSELVRKYPHKLIAATYKDFKNIVQKQVETRSGRIWDWQGDGGIAAFYFNEKNINSVLCGMEIILELFMYNLFHCKLNEDIHSRLAIHTGPCQFLNNMDHIQNETLKRLEEIETKYTKPDNLTLSPGVYSDLGGKLETFFKQNQISGGKVVYSYNLKWEK